MEPVNDAIAAKVEALIGGNQSVCILDVACGCGQPSFSIVDHMKQCSVVGVDSDSDCIEEAKRLCGERPCSFQVCDCTYGAAYPT